jgi:hypothetical protein
MTETKMEVVKLMPKEYTKVEADAFKHGFFLGAKSEREELIQEATEWIREHKEAVETEDNGIMGEDSLTLDGVITFDYYDGDKAYGCVAHDSFCLEDWGLKDRDEVKILILKK